jgi:hypothetical protein
MKTTRTSHTEVRITEIADTLDTLAKHTRAVLESSPPPDDASRLSHALGMAEAMVKALRTCTKVELNATIGELHLIDTKEGA